MSAQDASHGTGEELKHVAAQEKGDERPGFWSFENLRSLLFLILAIFAFRWSIASPYHVPTPSMEPTIKVGDRLLGWKLAYDLRVPFTDIVLASWGTPQRGDIIVFRYPLDPSIDYVKRVVGVAGDRIQVKDEILFINGLAQERKDYNNDRAILEDITDRKAIKELYRENLMGVDHWTMQNVATSQLFKQHDWPSDGSEFVVPPDSVFCMGDNRDNSADSRVWKTVRLENVRGKALFVLWSMYFPADGGWLPDFRWVRFGDWLQ